MGPNQKEVSGTSFVAGRELIISTVVTELAETRLPLGRLITPEIRDPRVYVRETMAGS